MYGYFDLTSEASTVPSQNIYLSNQEEHLLAVFFERNASDGEIEILISLFLESPTKMVANINFEFLENIIFYLEQKKINFQKTLRVLYIIFKYNSSIKDNQEIGNLIIDFDPLWTFLLNVLSYEEEEETKFMVLEFIALIVERYNALELIFNFHILDILKEFPVEDGCFISFIYVLSSLADDQFIQNLKPYLIEYLIASFENNQLEPYIRNIVYKIYYNLFDSFDLSSKVIEHLTIAIFDINFSKWTSKILDKIIASDPEYIDIIKGYLDLGEFKTLLKNDPSKELLEFVISMNNHDHTTINDIEIETIIISFTVIKFKSFEILLHPIYNFLQTLSDQEVEKNISDEFLYKLVEILECEDFVNISIVAKIFLLIREKSVRKFDDIKSILFEEHIVDRVKEYLDDWEDDLVNDNMMKPLTILFESIEEE